MWVLFLRSSACHITLHLVTMGAAAVYQTCSAVSFIPASVSGVRIFSLCPTVSFSRPKSWVSWHLRCVVQSLSVCMSVSHETGLQSRTSPFVCVIGSRPIDSLIDGTDLTCTIVSVSFRAIEMCEHNKTGVV